MSILRLMQPSFAAGELSPALWARVDLSKYATGLKRAKNMFVHPHGGISNRAGLEFIGETKGSGRARQIKFIFDAETDQTYNLVFTDQCLRIYRLGSPILNAAKTITAITQANPGVLTSAAHGYSNGQEIIISGVGGMTVLNGRNFIVRNTTTNTFTLEDMYGVAVNTASFPAFTSGGGARSFYEVVTPYVEADLPRLVYAQEKDVMYITNINYAPRKLSRLADNNWTLTTPTFSPLVAAPTGLNVISIFNIVNNGSETVQMGVTAVGSGGEESSISNLDQRTYDPVSDDGRVLVLTWDAMPGAVKYRIYRTNISTGFLLEVVNTTVEFDKKFVVGENATQPPVTSDPGSPSPPTSFDIKIRNGPQLTYVVSAISDATGEESLPSSPFTVRNALQFQGNRNLISWNTVAGAGSYLVYRLDNGIYGYIGRADTNSLTDDNITPDIAQGPQEGTNPFNSSLKYPRCVTFYEQRLAFAATKEEPSAIYLGQSANYENFGSAATAKASDAITFRIRSREKNDIQALVPSRGLGAFSSAGEWSITGGSEDFLSPTNVVVKPQGNRGSSYIQPILVGNIMLFAQARGGVVRDFSYDFAQDSFTGADLTILARHLFENRQITSWDYAQSPYSNVYARMDDDSLNCLTYIREHEIWAWTHYETQGKFLDCVSVPEGDEDAAYFIMEREVNGQTKRYIERLHTRVFEQSEDAFFVDSGLTYSGSAATVISGLDHLEGMNVVALADGNVVKGLEVINGTVTLPNAASKVHVGLSYEAEIQSLDIDMGAVRGLGTVQGRKKSIANMTLRVEKTRGIFVGPSIDKLNEYKQRSTEAWNEAIKLYTGDLQIDVHGDWTNGGNTYVKQFDPLPMTILAMMPEVTVGG